MPRASRFPDQAFSFQLISAAGLLPRCLRGVAAGPRQRAGPRRLCPFHPCAKFLSVALELSELGVNGIRLWKRSAFDANISRQSLYRGVVIGMATLSVLVITCLVVLSPQIVFPLSAIFAWAAVGFITLEIGLLQPALGRFMPPSDEVLSAIVEALMAAGVLLMGVTIMRTRRQMPLLSLLLVSGGGACIGMAAYSWFDPLLVKQIVRPVFAASVAIVLLTAASLVMRGGVRARSSILVWLMLGAWTIAAGYIALRVRPSELASPLLVGGWPSFLSRWRSSSPTIAFSSVLNPELDTLEAERNALALAGGEQVVWDYQPGDGSFHVGEQLKACSDTRLAACRTHPCRRGSTCFIPMTCRPSMRCWRWPGHAPTSASSSSYASAMQMAVTAGIRSRDAR
jgi:hypothetical protein